MRTSWIGALLIVLAAGVALAGPNAGGTLVLHNTQIAYSVGLDYCGSGPLVQCAAADARIDGSTETSTGFVFKVYAAFPQAGSPRLSGLIFGIQYDAETTITGYGPCADFELPQQKWPTSGFGTALTWNQPQLGHLTEVYWFAGYSEENPPHIFEVIPHPNKSGMFGDDSIPANIDRVAGYSSIGFGTDGIVLCPDSLPSLGACCRPGESCIM